MKLFIRCILLGVFFASVSCVTTETPSAASPNPVPARADVDTSVAVAAIERLLSQDEEEVIAAIEEIRKSSEWFAPPVFYLLSAVLYEKDERDEAMFWFYAGQLRGGFDANRCADISARQAIPLLTNQFGPQINEYSFLDLDRLTHVVKEVIAWDRDTGYEYDHRWINLHGMDVIIGGGSEMSVPESEWPRIAEETRQDYWEGFLEAVEYIKANR